MSAANSFTPNLWRKNYAINRGKGLYKNGKTYLVFQGTDDPLTTEDETNDPFLMVFDHLTNSWSDRFHVGVSTLIDSDDHGNPAMTIDQHGYIHVIYGGHAGKHGGWMKHRVSVNPYNPTEFRDAVIPHGNATYPSLYTLDNGDMVYIYRGPSIGGNNHKAHWWLATSLDNGQTWDKKPILLASNSYAIDTGWYAYTHRHGNDIHLAFSYRPLPRNQRTSDRHNVYYAKLSDGVLFNAAGKSIEGAITKEIADQSFLVEAFEENILFPSISTDGQGNPAIAYGKFNGTQNEIKLAQWNYGWHSQTIDKFSADSRFLSRTGIRHHRDGDYGIYTFGDGGQDLVEYRSSDGLWTESTIAIGSVDNPITIDEASSAGYLFFDDLATSDIRNGYLHGDAGFVTQNGIQQDRFTYQAEDTFLSANRGVVKIDHHKAAEDEMVRFNSVRVGDRIKFELDPLVGNYSLRVKGKKGPGRGRFNVFLDGDHMGVIDQYDARSPFKTWKLGDVQILENRDHTLEFRMIGGAGDRRFGMFDEFIFQRTEVFPTQEGA